jgi:hypothetical protein
MARLMRFDSNIIKKLSNFSDFCDELRLQLTERSSVLFQIILNFKAAMTAFELEADNRINISDEQFKERFRTSVLNFVRFLAEALICMYRLEKVIEREDDNTFFTTQNFHTLIISLIFED